MDRPAKAKPIRHGCQGALCHCLQSIILCHVGDRHIGDIAQRIELMAAKALHRTANRANTAMALYFLTYWAFIVVFSLKFSEKPRFTGQNRRPVIDTWLGTPNIPQTRRRESPGENKLRYWSNSRSGATLSFSDLGLSDELLRAVADAGYDTPTPIQEQAIPYVLMGRDIMGSAQTGTGKTASFTLPMIDILASGTAKARMPRSLILEPTRELAAQVADNFEVYGKYHKLNHALLIGGENMGEQLKVLEKGVDVLIATPGRLMDVFDRGHLLLRDVKILVIDESDRMLDMGFIPDVEKIVSLLPPLRTTLLFFGNHATTH